MKLKLFDLAFSRASAPIWILLAFQSGLINSFGFLNTGTFVSHVTGIGTQIGMAASKLDSEVIAELIFLPIAYILGAAACAWHLNYRPEISKVVRLRYAFAFKVILLMTAFFFLKRIGTHKAGMVLDGAYSAVLATLLCFLCGFQNSFAVWASNGKVRVTHITGLVTDIGFHLPKVFLAGKTPERMDEPRSNNLYRLGILLGFCTGGFTGALMAEMYHVQALLPAIAISVGLWALTLVNTDTLEW